MNQENYPGTLPLFGETDAPQSPVPASDTVLCSLAMEKMEWLALLAEEWWPLKATTTVLTLGISAVFAPEKDRKAEVIAWIDPKLLPAARVPIRREGKWISLLPEQLQSNDRQIAWPGPIPLFAIKNFTVASLEESDHLISLAQGFANLEQPEQPILVIQHALNEATPPPPISQSIEPPEYWNSFRGAAAMAVWSVPSIAPWVEMLCQLLSKPNKPSRPKKLPATGTPWLADAPWRIISKGTTAKSDLRPVILWRAVIHTLSTVNIRESWHPHEILEQVCDRARQYGLEPSTLDSLLLETSAILDDRKAIDFKRSEYDPMGFVLQLILLRPKPEKFVTWRSDLPPLPPAILWTGAILSGFINGYRNLEVRFRGSSASRKIVDLKTWELATKKKLIWPDGPAQEITWKYENSTICLLSNTKTWAERSLGHRGLWHAANLEDPRIREQAIKIATREIPEAVSQFIKIPEGQRALAGDGTIIIDSQKRELKTTGNILLAIESTPAIVELLDTDKFKNWLTTAALKMKLPHPLTKPIDTPDTKPEGLFLLTDFITTEQERELVNIVSSSPWSHELKRRVQHYGWKYDYKNRDIQTSSYLGPLPVWAQSLANRLHKEGLMPELADQVIVNEYIADQGISKHIDCPNCFKGPIVTISLIESWHMIFRKNNEKFEILLPRRSTAVISGSARTEWTHEIPQRKNEKTQLRSRRISLTFRKINDPAR